MLLTRHDTPGGARWAVDGLSLGPDVSLQSLLEMPRAQLAQRVAALTTEGAVAGRLLAPVEERSEVWAAGVTYLRSREAREDESSVKDVYSRVYEADRPELFFKSAGWRVVGHLSPIRVRRDSAWNVPEPELTLVVNTGGAIVGYCAGNDVSSRDIEGENPLYLPQAKVYDGSCALGPGIVLASEAELRDLEISLAILQGRTRGVRGRDAHVGDEAPLRGPRRIPWARAAPALRRVPDDRHRDRAPNRFLVAIRRRRSHHDRRADVGEPRGVRPVAERRLHDGLGPPVPGGTRG